MHILDSYINDIEPRIIAICDNSPKQEEASLQEALASYGWILLDSWIAWRTLRFLIRDVQVDESVQKKWFQTPSSYTSGQLRAAWKFNESILNSIRNEYGSSLKEIIDNTIQKKRNASAHFNKKSEVYGIDTNDIKKLFSLFSKVFLFCEINSFLTDVCRILKDDNFTDFKTQFWNSEGIITLEVSIDEFIESFCNFSNCDSFSLSCNKGNGSLCEVQFMKSGCDAIVTDGTIEKRVSVYNSEHDQYFFLLNKGYYRDVDLFVLTIEKCWNDSCDSAIVDFS